MNDIALVFPTLPQSAQHLVPGQDGPTTTNVMPLSTVWIVIVPN